MFDKDCSYCDFGNQLKKKDNISRPKDKYICFPNLNNCFLSGINGKLSTQGRKLITVFLLYFYFIFTQPVGHVSSLRWVYVCVCTLVFSWNLVIRKHIQQHTASVGQKCVTELCYSVLVC